MNFQVKLETKSLKTNNRIIPFTNTAKLQNALVTKGGSTLEASQSGKSLIASKGTSSEVIPPPSLYSVALRLLTLFRGIFVTALECRKASVCDDVVAIHTMDTRGRGTLFFALAKREACTPDTSSRSRGRSTVSSPKESRRVMAAQAQLAERQTSEWKNVSSGSQILRPSPAPWKGS